MMNLTSHGGSVPPGTYGDLSLSGKHRLESGVSFTTLRTSGMVNAGHCAGGRILMRSGCVVCSGNLSASALRGHGSILVRGDMTCGHVDFTGEIMVTGTLRIRCLRMAGVLSGPRRIEAHRIEMTGHLSAALIHVGTIVLSPLRSALLHRHGMADYDETSVIDTITACLVDAHALRCHRIEADAVTLSEGCLVERVHYRETLCVDATSAVIVHRHECDGHTGGG